MVLSFLEVNALINRNLDISGSINVSSQVASASVIRRPIVRQVLLDYLVVDLESDFPSDDSSCVKFISVYRGRNTTSDLLVQVPVTFDQQNKSFIITQSFTPQMFDPGDLLIVLINGSPCSADFNIVGSITLRSEVVDYSY